jgi:hypothetical protein
MKYLMEGETMTILMKAIKNVLSFENNVQNKM